MKGKTTSQEYIENWLLQINYPEIDVKIENSVSDTKVTFVQDRYLLSVYDESAIQNIQSPFKLE